MTDVPDTRDLRGRESLPPYVREDDSAIDAEEWVVSDSRGQHLVIGEGEDLDDVQASGLWVRSDTVMEREQ